METQLSSAALRLKESRVRPPLSVLRRLGLALALVVLSVVALSAQSERVPTVAAASSVDAKIEIVWPHNNAPVTAATKVNITAYLFESGGLNPIGPEFNNTVRLWRALNTEPAQQVGTGSKRMANVSGHNIPVWDFNDIDVTEARNPQNKYYFYLTVDGFPHAFNVWSHGADGRTYLPEPLLPSGVGGSNPGAVDARISILYPHDGSGNLRTVNNAVKGNITVRLFESGTQNSVGPFFDKKVRLLRMVNNLPAEVVAEGVKRTYSEGRVVHPVWDFNDVDVSLARNPANKVYFTVQVEGVPTFSSVWSHAIDARTYVPQPDIPFGQIAQAAAPPPAGSAPAPAPAPAPQPTEQASLPPAPAPRVGGSGFNYGIQGDFVSDGNYDRSFGAIRGIGFAWIKQQIEWKRYEPSKGNYQWGDIDRLVNAANGAGFNILLSVVKAPAWARPNGDDRSVEGPPANPQDYADFIGAMAARYQGRVQAYEIWNEQNLWYEWGGQGGRINAAAYMNLLRAAYRAVKANDGNALVISGALTPTGVNDGSIAVDDQAYLQAMYANGLRSACDGVGIHPSGFNNPPDADWRTAGGGDFKGHPSFFFRSTMEGYRNIMVANGDGNKRLWPTEFGWASVEGLGAGPAAGYGYAAQISESQQAQYIVRAYQMARNWGWVGPMFLWNLNFGPVSGARDEKAAFGIVRPDWSARPAFNALAGMPK